MATYKLNGVRIARLALWSCVGNWYLDQIFKNQEGQMEDIRAKASEGEGVLETANKLDPAISKDRGIFLVKAGDPLRLSGWCVADKKSQISPSKEIALLLVEYTTQKAYRLEARRFKRPDVAVSFRNRALESSGFICEALPKALPSGLYLVEAVQRNTQGEIRTVLGNGLIAIL